MKRIIAICALVTALAGAFGVIARMDARYAKATTVAYIAERLDEKIIQDRMDKLQERMWSMEDRWGERFAAEKNRIHDSMEELLHFMTKEARDHYRELEKEYKALEAKLKERDDAED